MENRLVASTAVINPARTMTLIPAEPPKMYKYSKWLLDKKWELVAKRYRGIKLHNALILWIPTILISLVVGGLSMWGTIALITAFSGIASPIMGVNIALLMIVSGLYTYTAMDNSKWIKRI